MNKIECLEALLVCHDPDLVVLTETWLSEDVFDSEIVPRNYKVFRKDRDRRGGGVAVLFKSSLDVIAMPDVTGVESLFCKLYINKVCYLLGAVYRPPNSSAIIIEQLNEYMHRHIKPEDRVILTGDFNLPNLLWNTFSISSAKSVENEMLDIMFNFDLLQVVNEATRIQNGSESILDLFFVSGNIKNKVHCSVTSGISDHKAVVLSLEGIALEQRGDVKLFPNFSKAQDESILDVLSFNYDSFKNNPCSVNDLWLFFKGIIHECIQRFVPMIAKKPNFRNPWISRDTLQLQRKLKRLKKRARTTNRSDLKLMVEQISEEVKNKIAHDKKNYFDTKLPSIIKTSPERILEVGEPEVLF